METAVLQAFEAIRCGLLDAFFSLFSFLAQTPVLGAVIAVVYWTANKRVGEFLLVNVLSGAALNGGLKDAVRRPRPYVAGAVTAADVNNVLVSTDMGNSFSFPSGHAQNGAALYFAGAKQLARPAAWLVSAAIVLLVMLSRVYLGVHYPTDVLAGAALGLAGVFFWDNVYRRYPEQRLRFFFMFSVCMCVCLFYAVSPDTAKSLGMALGASAGLLLEDRFIRSQVPRGWGKKLARVALGAVTIACVYVILKALCPAGLMWDFARYAAVLFSATFVAPLFFCAFGV